ncbi:MAG: cupredoxin domain-containing protein, partial [Thermomicrobiales bacterium]
SPAAEGATPAAAEGTPPPAEDPAAGAPAGGGEPIALDAVDPFVWSETALTASAGTVITVTNTGFLPHNFAIDEFGGVLVDLPSNLTTGDWTVPADATPGEYVFYCSIPGHRQSGMEGVLTIA